MTNYPVCCSVCGRSTTYQDVLPERPLCEECAEAERNVT